jgi:hypothetical protein
MVDPRMERYYGIFVSAEFFVSCMIFPDIEGFVVYGYQMLKFPTLG